MNDCTFKNYKIIRKFEFYFFQTFAFPLFALGNFHYNCSNIITFYLVTLLVKYLLK